ncbi:hypothetical protein C6P40_000145, partial [Pichia californica]
MAIITKILKYGDESPLQVVKKYEIITDNFKSNNLKKQKNFITIHGGAWRDINNTCNDFDKFTIEFEKLLNNNNNKEESIIVYSIDYEISSHKLG